VSLNTLVKIGSPVIILAASNCSLSNLHELETPQLPQTSHAYSKRQILVECNDIIVPFCRLSLTRDYFVPATVRNGIALIFQCVILTHYLNLKRQSAVQWKSLPFVSRFTSILLLEGSQLRLLNNISLLSVYLSQSKKKWWEF
jgi:hypothetical protein